MVYVSDERDQIPDTIVGIGKAGKTAVYELLEREWFLDDALAPVDGNTGPGFDAYVIDTATNEIDGDQRRTNGINERIEDKLELWEDKYDFFNKDYEDSRLEFINVYEESDDQYLSHEGLTADPTVRDIASQSGLRAWWLENNTRFLTGSSNFEEGVVRRRALSKALYFASRPGGGEDALDKVTAGAGKTCIIVGLGGGTGSGMCLDIARKVDQQVDSSPVLLGIIPGSWEEPVLRANAHAALSELEYLSVTGQNPFKNTILLPFGATKELEELDDFYDGLVQTLISIFKLGDNIPDYLDPSDELGIPEYAPFTIAVPQILRYQRGQIDDAGSAVDDFRDDLLDEERGSLTQEHELYDTLSEFIKERFEGESVANCLELAEQGDWPSEERFTLADDDVAKTLYRRLLHLRDNILDDEVFELLEREAQEDWYGRLSREIEDAETDAPEEGSISTEQHVLRNVLQPTEFYSDVEQKYPNSTADQELARVVRTELEAIRRRADLYRAVELLDDDIADGVRVALGTGGASVRPGDAEELNKSRRNLRDNIRELESDLSILKEFKQKYVDESEDIEREIDSWERNVEQEIKQLLKLDEYKPKIESELDRLEQKLATAVNNISRPDSAEEVPSGGFEFDFTTLNNALDAIGEPHIEGNDIEQSINALVRAATVWCESRDPSLLESLTAEGDPPYAEYREEFADHVELIDDSLFNYSSITGTQTFECSLDRTGFAKMTPDLDEIRGGMVNNVVTELERKLTSPEITPTTYEAYLDDRQVRTNDVPDVDWRVNHDEYIDALRTELISTGGIPDGQFTESGANLTDDQKAERRASEMLTEFTYRSNGPDEGGPVREGIYHVNVSPVTNKINKIATTLDKLRREQETLERLREIIREEGQQFAGVEPAPGEARIETTAGGERKNSPYVRETDLPGTGTKYTGHLGEYDILNDDGLRVSAEQLLGTFAENVSERRQDFTPIRKEEIESTSALLPDDAGLEETRYEGHRIAQMYVSRGFDTGERGDVLFEDIKDQLKNGIYVPGGEEGYRARTVGFGDKWDVGMMTFIGGVPLDNLSLVTSSAEGYAQAYSDDDIGPNLVRHNHALDGLDVFIGELSSGNRGAYVVRHGEDLFNLETPEGCNNFLTELVQGHKKTLLPKGDNNQSVLGDEDAEDGDDSTAGRITIETFESTVSLD